MEEKKPASKSKTIWFNLIGALFVTLEAFTGALHALMSESAYFALLAVSIGGNAALRYYTSQAIGSNE